MIARPNAFRGRAHLKSPALQVLACFCLFCGCRDQVLRPGDEAPPPSKTNGRYGLVAALTGTNSVKACPPRTLAEAGWNTAPFALLQTELSPAILIRCESAYLGLFRNLPSYGMEGPNYVAFSSRAGPRTFRRGDNLDVTDMEESWVVVWFAGAGGWAEWDSPWAVFLQEKPLAVKLDQAGLHFRFRRRAGEVALMPLYGILKLAPPGQSFAAPHGLPADKEIRTESWEKALPRDLLMRVRYWAGVVRVFPVYCEDQFRVEPARDTLTLRQRFEWHTTSNAWATRPIRFAPVSPVLALAARDGQFPVRFSAPLLDLDLVTPLGPYAGVEGVDAFDASFPLLKYIHETERPHPPDPQAHPALATALRRLQTIAQSTSADPAIRLRRTTGVDGTNLTSSDLLWLVKALPFCDPQVRTNAWNNLREAFRGQILPRPHLEVPPPTASSGQLTSLPLNPGLSSSPPLATMSINDPGCLELLWAYADLSGDWELIRNRWDSIKGMARFLAPVGWAGFGRAGVVSLGEQAAPCLALARMAYRVGDLDSYQYASALFARELTHHYVKHRGLEYFRRHPSAHSLPALPTDAYLTSLEQGTAGWHIDGPSFQLPASPGQYRRRWLRFDNEDVARFYRDFLRPDMARELDRFEKWRAERPDSEDNSRLPSLLQLRSLLLNLPSDQLAAICPPDTFSGANSRVLANCLALLRTSHPIHYERLIPALDPGPFLTGVERHVAGPSPHLIQDIRLDQPEQGRGTNHLLWPRITWGPPPPSSSGQPPNFGHIMPVPEGSPDDLEIIPLNWNTRILLYRPSRGDPY